MMNSILIANTLVLSLSGQPLSLPFGAEQIWVSKQNILSLEKINNHLVLSGQKEGHVFLSGFAKPYSDPQAVLVTSQPNFEAIKKCPAAVEASAEGLIAIKNESFLSNCAFSSLLYEASKTPIDESAFIEKEAFLKNQVSRLQVLGWQDNKRILHYQSKQNKSSIINHLGYLAPFYEVVNKTVWHEPGKTLIFDLTIFEFSRKKARALGLRLPRNINIENIGQGATFSSEGTTIGADFGESHGVGKILAQPSIRSTPGQAAMFMSGGEIAVLEKSDNYAKTQWKSYGLKISLTPDKDIELASPEVKLDFDLEYSEPDLSKDFNGSPSLIQRKLKSQFSLRCNENTILSTMLQIRTGKNRQGVAWLASIPLLGWLFSSHQQEDSQNELWFAIEPKWEEISANGLSKQMGKL